MIITGLRAGIQLVGIDCFNYTLHENGSGLGPGERKYASDTWRTAVRYYAGPGAGPKGEALTYVIGEPCIDVLDRACVEECPVDCIYEEPAPCTSTPTSAWTAGPASRCAR